MANTKNGKSEPRSVERSEVNVHRMTVLLRRNPKQTVSRYSGSLDSDSAEELRMPEYVCISNRYENKAEVITVKFHAIYLPELFHGPHQCDRVSLPKESGRDVLCQQRRQS